MFYFLTSGQTIKTDFGNISCGNQVKETEMGRRCSTYGGEVHTGL